MLGTQHRWTTYIPLALHFMQLTNQARDVQELCEGERFTGECSRDEVVVLSSALYGRMQLGRCVQMDMGYLGCEADVLGLADARCSGKRQCLVSVPDTDFERTRPCLELKSYLEVAYSCVRVVTARQHVCQSAKYVKVTAPSAYLASQVTLQTGCGTALCPWVIEVPKGQRINVTLFDFGWGTVGDSYGALQLCQKYGVIRELGEPKTAPICGSTRRETHQYLSDSHHLEIYLTPKTSPEAAQFLIKYQAVGCPDLIPGRGAVFQRLDMRRGLVECRYTDESWTLACQGTIWVGAVGNCSQFAPSRSSHFTLGSLRMPHGIAVAIVAGVAIVIGMLILTVGLVIFKRHLRKKDEAAAAAATYRPPPCAAYAGREGASPPHAAPPQADQKSIGPVPLEAHHKRPLANPGKNEYTHIWERPLPDPQGAVVMC